MTGYPECMRVLIEEFSKMPGVGLRTAERFAFHVLGADPESVERLADTLKKVNRTVRTCDRCFNLSEGSLCAVCEDERRDREKICVVEEPKDIITIEKSGAWRGVYHVLLGALSPLDAVGPQDLKIGELLSRVRNENIREVIIATTSDTEGEATAIYLAKVLKPFKARVTRIAQGVPVGADLEFADRATLMRAIEARHEI